MPWGAIIAALFMSHSPDDECYDFLDDLPSMKMLGIIFMGLYALLFLSAICLWPMGCIDGWHWLASLFGTLPEFGSPTWVAIDVALFVAAFGCVGLSCKLS